MGAEEGVGRGRGRGARAREERKRLGGDERWLI
jgi:hypothetical protein